MKTPFTSEQFFLIFEKYNAGIFPAQFLFFFIGIFLLVPIFRKSNKYRWNNIALGICWLWAGIVYHFGFFTAINKGAYFFGAIFILQGLLFVFHAFGAKVLHENPSRFQNISGRVIIYFGVVIYPLISYFSEGDIFRVISIGLPCPTTIISFGFFILHVRKIPDYMLVIPAIWAMVGVSAAINFHIYQDLFMPFAALCFFATAFTKRYSNNR